MIRTSMFVMAACITASLGLAAVSGAEESASYVSAKGTVNGRVTRVNPSTRNLFVMEEGKVVYLQLTRDTPIVEAGKPLPLERVAYGAEVRASYELRGDDMIASHIEVVPAQAKTPAPPAKPAGH